METFIIEGKVFEIDLGIIMRNFFIFRHLLNTNINKQLFIHLSRN